MIAIKTEFGLFTPLAYEIVKPELTPDHEAVMISVEGEAEIQKIKCRYRVLSCIEGFICMADDKNFVEEYLNATLIDDFDGTPEEKFFEDFNAGKIFIQHGAYFTTNFVFDVDQRKLYKNNW